MSQATNADGVMSRKVICIAAMLLAISHGPAALAAGPALPRWPVMSGETSHPWCRQAWRLADGMFRSSAFALNAPIRPIADLGSQFSLYRTDADISGGDGLANDPAVFAKREVETRTLYLWELAPRGPRRIAVWEQGVGWRGDIYTAFAIDAAIPPETFAARLAEGREAPRAFTPILAGQKWNPLLVLSDTRTGEPWMIDSGEPYEALPDWRVVSLVNGAPHQHCTIAFRPSAEMAVSMLPLPAQRFAALLDEALGPGTGEGTLQQTARMRVSVDQAWANAAVRPWALSEEPYNTREEVEAGLKAWSRGPNPRAAVYRRIDLAYVPAERSIAAFYRKRFGLSQDQARKVSAYVVETLFRSYFAFHREGPSVSPRRNPWPVP